LPTEYLREMLVLANEMFDSPPVFVSILLPIVESWL
jgi:hypothetical protein